MICLQECTERFAELLLKQDWLRQSYFVSSTEQPLLDPYGQLILSRLPFHRLRSYQFGERSVKRALFADFLIRTHNDDIIGDPLLITVANIHLPAGQAGHDTESDIKQRDGQLKRVLRMLDSSESHSRLLCGDFNFGDDSEENELLRAMQDCWFAVAQSRAGDNERITGVTAADSDVDGSDGYTADSRHNSLTSVMCPNVPPVRLDRILINRVDRLKPSRAQIVMNRGFDAWEEQQDPTTGSRCLVKRQYFPSDHFGVECSFDIL
jgi:poly(A) polymerase